MTETAPNLRLLHLTFDLPLYPRQLPQWRGAFNEMAGWENHLLHNHKGEKEAYHYRFPLVHYRMWRGKAAVTAINEGIEAVQEALAANSWDINWEGEQKTLQVEGLNMKEHDLRMLPHPKTYRLFNWLALNQENYEKWQHSKSLVQRAALLENILAGHILGFCTAMGYRLPERLEVNLHEIQFMKKVRLHGNPMIAFNITYDANVLLPSGIALGRGVSTGFGWQAPARVGLRQDKAREEREEASAVENG
ncbi:MAG: hypothetical protein H6573_35140 [Lewinellaceae bacterium]|nr:hypothetical protein [Lewinellaceae bacterium]